MLKRLRKKKDQGRVETKEQGAVLEQRGEESWLWLSELL